MNKCTLTSQNAFIKFTRQFREQFPKSASPVHICILTLIFFNET